MVYRLSGKEVGMEIQNVITLIDAVSAADIMNFQMEEGNFKVTIDKVNSRIETSVPQQQTIAMGAASYVQEATLRANNEAQILVSSQKDVVVADAVLEEAKKVESIADPSIKEIKSPIVGTFYGAAGPDVGDFVKVGDQVKTGQVLCIIEAMKLMNEIESDYEGEIVEILVKNEQMVEYNQPIYKVKVK